MKILVITRILSFIQDTIDEWRDMGYEVKQIPIYDREEARNYDVLFFEFVDNEMAKATLCDVGSKKRIIGRLHRCEYYINALNRYTFDWSKVHMLIITGEYFYNLIKAKGGEYTKRMQFIPYGVNERRFTFRDRGKEGFSPWNVAWLAKNFDVRKDPIKALSCFQTMLWRYSAGSWKFHMAAGGGERGIDIYKQYLLSKRPELARKLTTYRWQSDVNTFLEPMDVLLNTSINESFCFVIAEACLKGIKPLIWDFEGADLIWPREWTFFTQDEMCELLEGPFESQKYRDYIIDNFSLDKQVQTFDKILKG